MTQFAAVPFLNEEAQRVMKKFMKDSDPSKLKKKKRTATDHPSWTWHRAGMTRADQVKAFEEEVKANIKARTLRGKA